jgi:hypothetical protein
VGGGSTTELLWRESRLTGAHGFCCVLSIGLRRVQVL